MLNKFNQIRIYIKICILISLLVIVTVAQQSATGIKSIKEIDPTSIDPTSIDLTQPTLFVVPYTHLDDFWRWSYPQTIRDFLKHRIKPGQTVRTDAFPSLNSIGETHRHDKKITPPEETSNWLPLRLLNACLTHTPVK